MRRFPTVLIGLSALLLSACSAAPTGETTTGSDEVAVSESRLAPSVVVTTTILGSVVGDILTCAAGDDSSMTVLMPLGADPHDFQASSAQVAMMAGADLVVANGEGLEEGVLDAIESVEADGVTVLRIASLVDPLPFGDSHREEEGDAHSHDDDHDSHADEAEHSEEDDHAEHEHGEFDPHFWFDMERMALAAELIGEAFAADGDESMASCGAETAADIRSVDRELSAILASVPEDQRVLVTDHDALGYLAERYDYDVVGVVIPGGSTLGDPNSRELAELVTTIEDQEVRALFGDAAVSPDLLLTLSEEVGDTIDVVELFVGSLGGPDSGAESYLEMMKTNATRIATALGD